eukprot:3512432-Rhodomonas_salina.1
MAIVGHCKGDGCFYSFWLPWGKGLQNTFQLIDNTCSSCFGNVGKAKVLLKPELFGTIEWRLDGNNSQTALWKQAACSMWKSLHLIPPSARVLFAWNCSMNSTVHAAEHNCTLENFCFRRNQLVGQHEGGQPRILCDWRLFCDDPLQRGTQCRAVTAYALASSGAVTEFFPGLAE